MAIIDASVAVALVNAHEEEHARSWAWFEGARRADEPISAPVILLSEVAAALSRGMGDRALAHRLGDSDHGVRQSAREALQRIDDNWPSDPQLQSVMKVFVQQLRSRTSDERWVAAWAMGMFGEFAAPAVPALVEALTNSDQRVQRQSMDSLGAIGPKAKSAREALERLRDDPKHRWAAEACLRKIQRAAAVD